LQEKERQWAAQNIADYKYTLRISCFCPPEVVGPVVIEVRNRAAASVTVVESGEPANAQYFSRYDTVEKLFAVIQAAMDDNADSISVTYDSALGYPTHISIDHAKMAIDDEISYTITNFEIIK
jgi:hypothetical protein